MRLASFWAFHCHHSGVVWMTVCIIRVPVNLFLHLFVQSLDREIWKCDSSDRSWSHQLWHSRTEAQPPAQALGYSPHNTASRSHPDKALWPVSHISFMSSYGTMTDLGTLVPNLRAPGSQPFQSSPSYPKTSKASFCTRLKLLLLLLVCRRLKLLH